MPSPNAKKHRAKPPGRRSADWSPAARTIATVALLLHLAAVVLASWSIPPSSELSQKAVTPFRPYLRATYLNVGGYRFFAPNPPTHSNRVRYEVTFEDGQKKQGTFPDRDVHRPRLAYHRHFMIAEQVVAPVVLSEEDIVPASLPPAYLAEAPPEEIKRHREARREYVASLKQQEPALQSIAEHLLHAHGAVHVRLWLVQRRVPTPQDVIGGAELTDEKWIRERRLGEMTAGETWQWSEYIRGERN